MHRRVRRDRAAGPLGQALILAAALVMLGALAGACGGSPAAPVADVSSKTTTTTSASSGCSPSGCSSSRVSVVGGQGGELRRVHALARAHRLPQPSLGSNGLPNFSSGNSDLSPQPPHCHAAQGACKKDLPNLGPQTPAEEAAANAEALKHAGCIQSDGEPDFPHPDGQGLIQVNATVILQLVGRPSGSS